MAKIVGHVSGFVALPIQFKQLPSFPESVTHYIYLRSDEPKIPTAESNQSLFLVNIPITTTEQHLKHLFAVQLSSGLVKRVEFSNFTEKSIPHGGDGHITKISKKRKRITSSELEVELSNATLPEVWDRHIHPTGSHAVVVFVDRPSMEGSLKAAKRAVKLQTTILWGEGIEDKLRPLGLKRYETHRALCYPSRKELLNSVDSYMNTYTRLEETRSQEEAKKRQQPDEEGFITVTKGARGGVVRREDARELGEKEKQKEKDKGGIENFYRFQMRERRKEEQGELKRRFEEDKRRVEEMRKRRVRVVVGLMSFGWEEGRTVANFFLA
jgi:Ribosomal RNA-processing protein 7 (RRP7) C-terminal domain/Rrp7 RRM-like N-terminal domain